MSLWVMVALVAELGGCDARSTGTGPPAAPPPRIEGQAIVYTPGTPELAAIVVESSKTVAPAPAKLTGRLVWDEDRTVQVYTPFAGRITKILANTGDKVTRGQRLAIIASPDFGQAQSEKRRAQTDFALARQNLLRARELSAGGIIAQKELESAEADYARAQSELARTTVRLDQYGKHGTIIDQQFALTSPIDGVVMERNLNVGQEVRPDQLISNAPATFIVSDPTSLWFQLDAEESDAAYLHPGLRVVLQSNALPGERFDASLVTVSDFLDPNSRTLRARGRVGNAERKLKVGMLIAALVPRSERPIIELPSKAVFLSGEKYFVFVAESATRFVKTEIRPGAERGGRISVLSGISEGTRVVTDGALLLQQMLKPAQGG